MPAPLPPTVPGFTGPRPQPPSFGPQPPQGGSQGHSQGLPPLQLPQVGGGGPAAQPAPPSVPRGPGAPAIYGAGPYGGNVGPWGAMSGSSGFSMPGIGGLPSLAGAFQAARNMIGGSAGGIAGGILGSMVAGPVGGMAGRYIGNNFFGGAPDPSLPAAWTPDGLYQMGSAAFEEGRAGGMQNTSPEDLAALQERMQGPGRGFGSYRGSGGFVTGVIDPNSMGIYEGSGHDRSRAPQTSADNQMR